MESLTEQEEKISSYIGNLLHESFGKKPDFINISFAHTFMTVYIRNFVSPQERVLLEHDQEILVHQMRQG